MLANTGKLAGCTLFITGASRGIGKAIALKAAKDGANIVIAAKTGVPHRTLPGTIYTAAEEIEAAGGKALPCIVNVREEEQIIAAVDQAVQRFGGIDVLVNNASAISLTGTLETPMKKVDLMMSANTRGTYLTSKICLPYLKKSKIGHILNISPPINLNPIWFKNHCVVADAYNFIPDWAEVLYQQVIVNGDFSYLEEYKQRGLLKASTIEEIAQKCKQHRGSEPALKNLKNLLTYCDDIYVYYKLAYDNHFYDVVNMLLKDVQTGCCLNDLLVN